jgi:hypothetical protein
MQDQPQRVSAISSREGQAIVQHQVTINGPGSNSGVIGGGSSKQQWSPLEGGTVSGVPAAAAVTATSPAGVPGARVDQIPFPPLPLFSTSRTGAGRDPTAQHQQRTPSPGLRTTAAAPLALPFTLSPAFAAYLDSHPPDATWTPPSPVAGPSPPASPHPISPTAARVAKGGQHGAHRATQPAVPGGAGGAPAGGSQAGSHGEGLSAYSGMHGRYLCPCTWTFVESVSCGHALPMPDKWRQCMQ